MGMWGGAGASGWSQNIGGGRMGPGGGGGPTGRNADGWDDDALGKVYDAELMRKLRPYLRPYKWQVAFAFVAMAVQATANYIQPLVVGFAVAAGVRHDVNKVGVFLAIMVSMAIAGWLSLYTQQILINTVGNKLLDPTDLR